MSFFQYRSITYLTIGIRAYVLICIHVYVCMFMFIEWHVLDCIYVINRMGLGFIVNCMVHLVLDRKMFALNYGLGKLYFFLFLFMNVIDNIKKMISDHRAQR